MALKSSRPSTCQKREIVLSMIILIEHHSTPRVAVAPPPGGVDMSVAVSGWASFAVSRFVTGPATSTNPVFRLLARKTHNCHQYRRRTGIVSDCHRQRNHKLLRQLYRQIARGQCGVNGRTIVGGFLSTG
jgi:hypothetical protein